MAAQEHVGHATDADFQKEVLEADKPVLVDFEQIANEYAGKAVVCKMNTDDQRQAAIQFGISAIPTIILFKDGQMVKKWVGLTQKSVLTAAIDEAI